MSKAWPKFDNYKLELDSRLTLEVECQSCGGLGWVKDQIFYDSKNYKLESSTCHKCDGKGYLIENGSRTSG